MTEAHEQQIQEGAILSLIAAGVGRAFADRRLDDCPSGAALKEWIKSGEAWRDIGRGRGRTLVGLRSYETFVVLARALHMTSTGVYVVPVRRLLRIYQHPTQHEEAWERVTECTALFITGFHNDGHAGAFRPYEVQDLEEMLTDRIASLRALFVQCADPLFRGADGAPAEKVWWSAEFLDRLCGSERGVSPMVMVDRRRRP